MNAQSTIDIRPCATAVSAVEVTEVRTKLTAHRAVALYRSVPVAARFNRSISVAVLIAATMFAAAHPVHAQSGGGYNIKKSTIDSGGHSSLTGSGYRLGGTIGQPDAHVVTGPGGYRLTGGFWSPASAVPPTPPPAPHDRRKNRYISFAPNNGGLPVAFKVARTYGILPAFVELGWVDTPDADGISKIVSTPVIRVWGEPVIHAGDCEIIPVADYEMRASADGVTLSAALTVSTIAQPVPKFWADTVGAFGNVVPGQWDPPNGVVNVNDYVAALQKFLGISTAPHVTVVDVQAVSSTDPCLNRVANIADVFLIIKAFQGNVYPFETNPANCPQCP